MVMCQKKVAQWVFNCPLLPITRNSLVGKRPMTQKFLATPLELLFKFKNREEIKDFLFVEYFLQTFHSFVLVALLSGARNERNSRLAQQVYDRMKKNFPQSKDVLTSGSTLLANLYGSIGDMEQSI